MISKENQKRFEELIEEIKGLAEPNTTSIKITITSEQTKIVCTLRHPEDLAKRNISMKNIKGEWIKK